MMRLAESISRVSCAVLLVVACGFASAQSSDNWPNKPVRIIVPYAPGGVVDAVARLLNDKFAREFGQPFIIDNRPGGDGILGMGIATRAASDGYTLAMDTAGYVVNRWLHPDLGFDAIRELTPISMLTRGDVVVVAYPTVAPGNLKEFIGFAKANPGKLNAWSGSSIQALHYYLFMNMTGARLTIVNYKAAAQGMVDLLAGRVDVTLTNVANSAQHIKAGKLKGVAYAGVRRSAQLPEVSTFAESGVDNFDVYYWTAILAPGKTPRDIMDKLNLQVRKALDTPDVIGALTKRDVEPNYTTLAQARQFISKESERYSRNIKETGMKPEGR